jgi:hypothetical protein
LRVINFAKGSKKQLQQIRWTHAEIASAALLTFVMIVGCIWVAFWSASDIPHEPQPPSLEIRR